MAEETRNVVSNEKPWWMPKPFQKTVALADGTILNGSAGLSSIEDDLWIWLDPGTPMTEAFGYFIDPEKTASITTELSSIEKYTYNGYTRLTSLQQNGNKVTVRLNRPAE